MNIKPAKQLFTRQLPLARDVIHAGGVVAYPTENCFGLGCHPKDYLAVKKILNLKQRPTAKGLILIGSDMGQLRKYIEILPDELMVKMASSWPSSTTWLVPAAPWVPSWLKGDSDNIAIRIPAHKLARQLCKHCGHALVSTSANPSGRRPARSSGQVYKLFFDDIDYVIDASCGSAKRPSTIIDLLTDQIIRP